MTDETIEPLAITQENAANRVYEAIHTIIHCWSDWEAEANQQAQFHQSNDVWFHELEAQLRAVIEGMLFDGDDYLTPEEEAELDAIPEEPLDEAFIDTTVQLVTAKDSDKVLMEMSEIGYDALGKYTEMPAQHRECIKACLRDLRRRIRETRAATPTEITAARDGGRGDA